MPRNKKHNDYGTGIPLHEVDALVEILYPKMVAFFECPKVQKEFEEWLKNRESKEKEGSR